MKIICWLTGHRPQYRVCALQVKQYSNRQWRIQKILVGGDLKHKTSKIRMSTKIESDFSAKIGNSNVFFAQIQVVSKKKKKKRSSRKLRLIFRRISYV